MSPDLIPAMTVTAVVVLLLVLGALKVAAGYRRTRRTLRRIARTRLVITNTPSPRSKKRRARR